ncbi:MAG: NAD(P)/FAD-dependent oxidoreductase [Erysipelotrichia bacterium]|nr:NAD(P)/FAD-dependent oxidoreductase [Erysipelotrichia bacterium]
MKKILIIGSGAAGIAAAEAARERDTDCSVTVISQETELPYNRPMLTKNLCDSAIEAAKIAIHPANWYQDHRINLIQGKKITALLPDKSAVADSEGTQYEYDSLILALGASCFVPPIAGSDSAGVHTIRKIADVKLIQEQIAGKSNAAVIGGGVLGLEAAASLSKAGLKVTVLEAMPRLMPRQLDEEAAENLMQIAAEKGVLILTGQKITTIEPGRVITETGTYSADTVIISAGVRANIQLAKEAGIVCDRAIVINDKAETNLPHIYACGDCAQLNGVNYALWSQALAEGTAAGNNAAGGEESFRLGSPSLTFFGLGTTLCAAGDNSSNPDAEYTSIDANDNTGRAFRRITGKDDHICGFEMIGTLKGMKELQEALGKHVMISEAEQLLKDIPVR